MMNVRAEFYLNRGSISIEESDVLVMGETFYRKIGEKLQLFSHAAGAKIVKRTPCTIDVEFTWDINFHAENPNEASIITRKVSFVKERNGTEFYEKGVRATANGRGRQPRYVVFNPVQYVEQYRIERSKLLEREEQIAKADAHRVRVDKIIHALKYKELSSETLALIEQAIEAAATK